MKQELKLNVDEVWVDLRELTIHYTVWRYPNAANALPSQLYDEPKAKDLIRRAERILGWVERNKRHRTDRRAAHPNAPIS